MDLDRPKEACIRGGPDCPCERAIIRGKDMLGHARQHCATSCAEMAEPIDLLFGLWTWVGRRKLKFSCIELSVCGGDAALVSISQHIQHHVSFVATVV